MIIERLVRCGYGINWRIDGCMRIGLTVFEWRTKRLIHSGIFQYFRGESKTLSGRGGPVLRALEQHEAIQRSKRLSDWLLCEVRKSPGQLSHDNMSMSNKIELYRLLLMLPDGGNNGAGVAAIVMTFRLWNWGGENDESTINSSRMKSFSSRVLNC